MGTVAYLSVHDAIRANEKEFYSAVKSGIESWASNSTQEQIHNALFVAEQKTADQKAA